MQTTVTPSSSKTADIPTPGATSLPQRYFVSPDVFTEEQDKIFARRWLLVGHQSQIAKPGDYFVIEPAGESLIVIRDSRFEIRGFYNVCRHRGTRLKEDTCGHASAIQCPYHAWTYGLDGRLIGAPHMDEVPGFDKADYSLHAVNLALWEGFIFVNLADTGPLTSRLRPATAGRAILSHPHSSALTGATRPSLPAGENLERRKDEAVVDETRLRSEATARRAPGDFISLERWFAPLSEKFANWNMSILRPVKRVHYDIRANWKLMFENYSECYHCPGVHPQLQKVSPYDSAENDLTEGPFLGGFMKVNKGKSLSMSGNTCALPITGDKELATASPSGGGPDHDYQKVFYYSIFANMLLSMHPEYVMVHQLWPKSPERTLIVCDWFFHPDAIERKDFNPEDAIEFWDITNKQDWHVCELSQQGIASRAYEPGPYSSRESIPAAWDDYYLRVMR